MYNILGKTDVHTQNSTLRMNTSVWKDTGIFEEQVPLDLNLGGQRGLVQHYECVLPDELP